MPTPTRPNLCVAVRRAPVFPAMTVLALLACALASLAAPPLRYAAASSRTQDPVVAESVAGELQDNTTYRLNVVLDFLQLYESTTVPALNMDLGTYLRQFGIDPSRDTVTIRRGGRQPTNRGAVSVDLPTFGGPPSGEFVR